MRCGVFSLVSFTSLLQGNFNGTGAIVIVPQIRDAILNNRGQIFRMDSPRTVTITKTNQSKRKPSVYLSVEYSLWNIYSIFTNICLCNVVYNTYGIFGR